MGLHDPLKLTLQVYEKKKGVRWKYDLGRRKNFEQVIALNSDLLLASDCKLSCATSNDANVRMPLTFNVFTF